LIALAVALPGVEDYWLVVDVDRLLRTLLDVRVGIKRLRGLEGIEGWKWIQGRGG
jgi:hypothetical protein